MKWLLLLCFSTRKIDGVVNSALGEHRSQCQCQLLNLTLSRETAIQLKSIIYFSTRHFNDKALSLTFTPETLETLPCDKKSSNFHSILAAICLLIDRHQGVITMDMIELQKCNNTLLPGVWSTIRMHCTFPSALFILQIDSVSLSVFP